MIENLTNQVLAMEPKSAKSLIGSLTHNKNINLIDASGNIDSTKKPRIIQSNVGYYGASNTYDSKPFLLVDGIAIIPVSGSLIHRLGYISSYWSGYDAIVNMFDAANSDPDVKGILMVINSPGGTVAGCFDAADHIYENKGEKPLWALYDDMACSGAMCIASTADKRLTTQTAISGSIGVVQIHASYEAMLNDAGMNITLIYSGEHKVDGNPYKNLPDEVYEDFKAQCSSLREQFAQKVSRNIGLSVEQVLETEAKTYTGQEAVDVGLADEMVNSHDIISYFQQSLSDSGSTTIRSVTMSEQQSNVTTESVTAETEVTQESLEVSVEVDQQSRCESIVTSEAAQGRSKLANHLAFKTDLSVEQAVATLEMATAENAVSNENALDAAMSATEQPEITAMSEQEEASEASQYVSAYKTLIGEK